MHCSDVSRHLERMHCKSELLNTVKPSLTQILSPDQPEGSCIDGSTEPYQDQTEVGTITQCPHALYLLFFPGGFYSFYNPFENGRITCFSQLCILCSLAVVLGSRWAVRVIPLYMCTYDSCQSACVTAI